MLLAGCDAPYRSAASACPPCLRLPYIVNLRERPDQGRGLRDLQGLSVPTSILDRTDEVVE